MTDEEIEARDSYPDLSKTGNRVWLCLGILGSIVFGLMQCMGG